MRASFVSALGFTTLLACSATADIRFPQQLSTLINDPEASLIRGHVIGLEIGDPGGMVVIVVKVEQSRRAPNLEEDLKCGSGCEQLLFLCL